MTTAQALQAICADAGITDAFDHPDLMDSCQPGCCLACGTVSEPHEPDADANWCPSCGESRVSSLSILLGII